MNTILFDNDKDRINLLPLTYTRPVSEIRVGIHTITEKWGYFFKKGSSLTQNYLKQKYSTVIQNINLLINGSIIPNLELADEIKTLKIGEFLVKNDIVIAGIIKAEEIQNFTPDIENIFKPVHSKNDFTKISYPWDIFRLNGQEIEADFKMITAGRKSEKLSKTNNILQEDRIFVEKGVKAEFAIINPDNGYIYLGKNSEIMEGAIIRGSFSLGEHSTLKMGAKIYGPTTIGLHSKVGGEINNSVIFGYTNKGHDGFLGNSILGEWCNLGADTNNSNLKNNYAEVRVWNYNQKRFIPTGMQFCGLIMGDHSKCGINTMFNTGTVVGVCSNIFGTGFPRNFVPSFSWGGNAGFTTYTLLKVYETAEIVMQRRNVELNNIEKNILEHIFNETKKFRED